MLFKDYLAVKMIANEKNQTRRWTPNRPCTPGKLYYAQLKLFQSATTFAQFQVLDVWEWDGIQITPEDAIAEGFKTPENFMSIYKEINLSKTSWTGGHKKRRHWAVLFDLVGVYYHPELPNIVKSAIHEHFDFQPGNENSYPDKGIGIWIPKCRRITEKPLSE